MFLNAPPCTHPHRSKIDPPSTKHVRERERKREWKRKKERKREKERERETGREIEREEERKREKERERERRREKEREKEKQRENGFWRNQRASFRCYDISVYGFSNQNFRRNNI